MQGYLQRTNSECLHVQESEERVEERDFEVQEVQTLYTTRTKPHPHIDNLLLSSFYGLYCILETEQLFFFTSILPNKERVKMSFVSILKGLEGGNGCTRRGGAGMSFMSPGRAPLNPTPCIMCLSNIAAFPSSRS